MKKNLLRMGFTLLAALVLYVAVVLIHGTLSDWQPSGIQALEAYQAGQSAPVTDSIFSLAIWNIGYAGLGAESDFFYDQGRFLFSGGGMIRSPKEAVDKNLAGITQMISSVQSDFFLLQEVDIAARRSYFLPVFDSIRHRRPGYAAFFAPNYKVARMPLPLFEPWRAYGRVLSGLATLSRWQPEGSERVQLPGKFGWPTRLFQLDRCLAVHRFPTSRGKDLIVINAHNSAHDAKGEVKREEMALLRKMVLDYYQQGCYVIVGADWNQTPPNFQFDTFSPHNPRNHNQINIDPDFLPADWTWVYDPTQPTNRKLYEVYRPGETFTTLIDFFLISPNVRVRKVKTISQDFQYSDHQPVWMEVELK